MPEHPRNKVITAWAVHAFTLTGIIWATLALLALIDNQPKLMWLYLGIALVVDGVDGSMARAAQVEKYAPNFDGVILDSIVDYLTWTFIPALFMYTTGLLGTGAASVILLLLINVTSMFCYANAKMKTNDYYFMGFPAAWNIVALALWFIGPSPGVTSVVVIAFSILTWAPIAFVHPLRVKRLMPVNIAAAAVWIGASALMVAGYPTAGPWTTALWIASGVWLVALGVVRSAAAAWKSA